MESSDIAGFGMFLLLGFVVPGFCYLLALGFCFKEFLLKVLEKVKEKELSGLLVTGLAIVVGLFVSSVTFGIEVLLRSPGPTKGIMDHYFPSINFNQVALFESQGKSILSLQMLTGSAVMHWNVGLGLILILLWWLCLSCTKHAYKTGQWSWKGLPLALCLVILAFSNLIDSHWVYWRVSEAIRAVEAHSDCARCPAADR